jgi:hypothetical protein
MRLLARQKRVLGIVVGEHSMLVAEVSCDRPATTPPRLAEFPFPGPLTIEEPAELGVQFRDFLTQNSFTASAVVFGVPAKRLVTRPVEIPPADPRTATQMLWLQTQAHASEDLGPMVFDFSGQTSRDQPSTLNLIGLQRTYLDRLLSFADAAGLKPFAVHATIAALAAATLAHARDAICLSVRCDGAEMSMDDGSNVRLLKHMAPTGALPRLIAELRRNTVANPSAAANSRQRKLVLWDDCGLDGVGAAAIGQAAGMAVVPGDVRWLDGMPASQNGASPLALLLPLRNGHRLAPDFLRPRIKTPRRRMLSPGASAICAAIAAALIVAIAGYADILHLQSQIAASRHQLDALAPQLETARPFTSQMQFARTFVRGESSYLTCLKDLTVSVPQEGQTYLTSFVLEADMKGACIGHSGSDQDVLDLLDKLNSTGRFTGLSRRLSARPKGNSADVLFNISFTYVPSG